MKEAMDWEAAFTETQDWTKKAAERSRRLLGAVAEMRDTQIALSQQIEALTRSVNQNARRETHSSEAQPNHLPPVKVAQPLSCLRGGLLGFGFGLLVAFMLT